MSCHLLPGIRHEHHIEGAGAARCLHPWCSWCLLPNCWNECRGESFLTPSHHRSRLKYLHSGHLRSANVLPSEGCSSPSFPTGVEAPDIILKAPIACRPCFKNKQTGTSNVLCQIVLRYFYQHVWLQSKYWIEKDKLWVLVQFLSWSLD